MGRIERSREIARRRIRRVKLQKLRAKYAAAATESEKADLQAKARRMSSAHAEERGEKFSQFVKELHAEVSV